MEKKKLSIGTVIILLVIVAAIAVAATYMITKTEKQNTNSNGVEKKTSNSDISKESDVANSEIPKNNTEDKKDSEDKIKYLNNILNNTYLKDIIERNNLKGDIVIDTLVDILASDTATLTNPTKLSNSFISHSIKTNTNTISTIAIIKIQLNF